MTLDHRTVVKNWGYSLVDLLCSLPEDDENRYSQILQHRSETIVARCLYILKRFQLHQQVPIVQFGVIKFIIKKEKFCSENSVVARHESRVIVLTNSLSPTNSLFKKVPLREKSRTKYFGLPVFNLEARIEKCVDETNKQGITKFVSC